MNNDWLLDILSYDELMVYKLRSLYNDYGYSHYRMSKFEEYELYVRNKDFLVSDNVITFTDTDGRLLALKPDVTLSIIKNSRDVGDGIMKACYNENVYRVSKGTHSFKEIMQVGLECLGKIDNTMLLEVLSLAKLSLNSISPNNVLEISHLDIVSGVIDSLEISEYTKREILSCLAKKNIAALQTTLSRADLSAQSIKLVEGLGAACGSANDVLPKLSLFCVNEKTKNAVDQLTELVEQMDKKGLSDGLVIDFSVVNDMNYYNGISFTGFIEGVPVGVLSGGQYDKMMRKMKRKDGAVGFAVYLDELERLQYDTQGRAK